MKYLLLAFLALFVLNASAALITSAGRDYYFVVDRTIGHYSVGSWHYEARFNNGTTAPMVFCATPNYWTDVCDNGNGIVTNASTTFNAEPGTSLVFDGGTTAGGRAVSYNTSINWTANTTASLQISGWYKRTPLTTNNYNLTFWQNGNLVWTVSKTDATNYTYSTNLLVTTGDNLSFTLAPTTIDQDVYVNFTAYVTAVGAAVINAPTNNSENTTLDVSFNYSLAIVPSDGIKNASIWTNVTGWLRQASNSSEVVTTGFNWINTSFPTPGQYKVAVETCDLVNVCGLSSNYTINLTQSVFKLSVLNESNQALMYYNITISNATNTTAYAGAFFWFNKTRAEIPTGTIQIVVKNTTQAYTTRTYYAIFNGTNLTLTGFLALSSTLSEVDVALQDYAGIPLSGYYVRFQRAFNGTSNWSTIAETQTDYAGKGVVYLDITQTYRVLIFDTNQVLVQVKTPVLITADTLIATNIYKLPITVNPPSYLPYWQMGTVTAQCSFDNATNILSCTASDASFNSVSANLTVNNLTARGFVQICSNVASGFAVSVYCTISGANNSYLQYKLLLTNSDGTTFVASSGIIDNRPTSFSWGTQGGILFFFLLLLMAGIGVWNMNVMLVTIDVACLIGMLTGLFPISWPSLISIWLVSGLIMFKSRG